MFHTVPVPDYVHKARVVELYAGQVVEGIVLRLPGRNIHAGTRLFLQTDTGEAICFPATARAGWAVLERALIRERVAPGDRVAIRFREWRQTADGERRYRDVDVMVLDGMTVERAA
jgi:hypothetical protein